MGNWFPDLWKFVFRRAARRWSKGEHEKAIRILSRYAQLRPRDRHSWEYWARLVEHSGDRMQAETILRDGLRSNPDSPELLVQLADVLSLGNSGPKDSRWIEAGRMLERAQQIDSNNPHVLVGRFHRATFGIDFDEMRRLGRACRLLMAYEDLDQRHLALELAQAMVGIPGLEQDATDLFQHLLDVEGGNYLAHVHLAMLLERVDPVASANHLDRARATWRNPRHTVDEMVVSIRESIADGYRDEQA